jgi:hypothetical protein
MAGVKGEIKMGDEHRGDTMAIADHWHSEDECEAPEWMPTAVQPLTGRFKMGLQ